MLEYNENTLNAKILAIHYAEKLGGDTLAAFMKGECDIKSNEDAEIIISGFWAMTDLAISDNNSDVIVDGISDIEFWMHKLFNKVGGYMIRNGYKTQWEDSLAER